VPCPVCKEPLQKEQDLHPVSRDGDGGSKMLHQMLSNTRIMCANNPKCSPNGNCNWTGDYGSYQEHIRQCKNLPIADCPLPSQEREQATLSKQGEAPAADTPSTGPASSESELDPLELPSASEMDGLSADDVAAEHPQIVSDTDLAGLIGALMELKADEYTQPLATETDETCSTNASEQFGSMEASDAELEHIESPVESDAEPQAKNYAVEDADQSRERQEALSEISKPTEVARRPRKAKAGLEVAAALNDAKLAQDAAARAQYHAARFQAAQYQQMAQYQAAQYQAAQLQMAQWQQAQWQCMSQAQRAQATQASQAAYYAQAAQMHASQAMQARRSRAAQ